MLSLIVFTPLIGVLLLLFVPGSAHRAIRWIALAAALGSLASSLTLPGYDPAGSEFQFREDLPWIEAFGMRYTLGVDGLSVVLGCSPRSSASSASSTPGSRSRSG